LKKLVRSEKGSVTLFLLLIFIGIFFFNAVLIDYSRIMAASKEVQNGMHASVRAVMADYDPALKEYGLYAIANPEEVDDVFYTTLANNFTSSIDEDFFRFTNITLEASDSAVEVSNTLADHDWFEYQVKEEMKYKAIIEASLAIKDLSIFSKISGEVEKYQEKAEEYEKLAEEREELLNKANRAEKKLISELNKEEPDLEKVSEYKTEFRESVRDAEKKQKSIKGLQKEMDDLTELLEEQGGADDTVDFGVQEIYHDDYFEDMNVEFDHMQNDLDTYEEQVNERQEERKTYNKQIEQAKDKAEDEAQKKAQAEANKGSAEERSLYGQKYEYDPSQSADESQGQELDALYSSYYNEATAQPDSYAEQSPLNLLQALQEFVDPDMFLNEYTILHFNNHVSSVKQKEHVFSEEEVEYVIYGEHSPGANFAKAYVDLLEVRSAIRAIEGIVMFKGGPLPVTAIAVTAYAASMAAFDVARLVNGMEVELTKYARHIKLGYEHYMRIFLFRKVSNIQKMSRMQALISIDTGIDLKDRPVYVVSNAEPSIELLFIPRVIKALNLVGVMEDRLDENGLYKIKQKAAMYY
jgi:hypothetical protein